MKYLCLIYSSDADWERLSDDEREAVYDRYRAFAADARAAGKLVDGGELQPAATATTVRVRDRETLVSDGPYAKTREQLAGYFVLECDDLEEALALAAKIPAAEQGCVEVRPEYVEVPVA
jgi:hypothetical protein